MVRRIKNYIKKMVFYFLKPPVNEVDLRSKRSFSQAGEDLIVNHLFESKGIRTPTYMDIGTNHPYINNNTYLFYCKGSRGVCIEADLTLIEEIARFRPGDKVLNVGVNVSDTSESDFYIFNESGLNTFNKKEAEHRQSFGTYSIKSVVKVRLESINSLISQHYSSYPDVISLDIEGLDLDVLKTINWVKYPVPVICAETCTYSENHIKPKDESISDYMSSIGYETYADTYINTIYVNKDWFRSLGNKTVTVW